MTTIDLGAAPPPSTDTWAGVPRRVGLTLPELTYACSVIDAPMPFEVAAATAANGLDARLGQSRSSAEDEAYAAALAATGDPAESLGRRGLLAGTGSDATLDPGLAGALGLLATPEVAVDLDVAIGGLRGHAWHRQHGDTVATIATVDGLVFEVSWFPVAGWAAELGRAAALPEDLPSTESGVPDHVEVPFALADAVFEALRSGRGDLVPVLTSGDPTLASVLTALTTESRGRLRAVVAAVSQDDPAPIGVVSWTLVADGWRALRPQAAEDEMRVVISTVEPSELAADLAPVLAEVTR